MIRCRPKGICSSDFFLDGEGHRATLEFNWRGEQGAITADGMRFEVRKHGFFSLHWTLDHAGIEFVSGQDTTGQESTVLTHSFEIQDRSGALLLRAESPFRRSFRVERSGDVIATISPDNFFTCRATIETLAHKWDFATICFSFWLVLRDWRQRRSGG